MPAYPDCMRITEAFWGANTVAYLLEDVCAWAKISIYDWS